MAKTPRPPKPKLPKKKEPLGKRIRSDIRNSVAKGLSKNFGVVGSMIAKRYVAAPKVPRKRIADPGNPNPKNIPKKNVKKDAPIVDSIIESGKLVASTIDIVALNAGRSFSVATKQANIMGDEITASVRELNNALDRILYKGAQPPPLPSEGKAGPILQSQPVQQAETSRGPGIFPIPLPSLKTTAILSIIPALKGLGLMSGQGGISTSREDMLSEIEKNNQSPEAQAASKRAEAIRNWFSGWFGSSTDKIEVGKDDRMMKLTYKADKISFKSENSVKFKSRAAASSFKKPQSGGFFNKLLDKMTGGPGSAGFFNNLADRAFGTGSQMPGGVNSGNAGNNGGGGKSDDGGGNTPNVSKPDIDYQGPNSGAYDSTKARANYMQPGPDFGKPGENITTVQTEGGHKFQIHSASADAFKRFIESAEKEGMPLGNIGGYSPRPGGIAGTGRMSQHSMGNAMDIGSQTARDVISPKTREWIESHPKQFRKMLDDSGMVSGGDWKNPDLGHIEWSGRKPWLEDKDGKPLPKDGVSPVEKDAAGSSALKAFDGDVGDGKEEEDVPSGFDFKRWDWMRKKDPSEIEDRTGEDPGQWNTVTAKAAAQIRAIAGSRWLAAQPLPDPSTLSIRLGSNNLDFALIANSRKDIRESLGLPDPKKSSQQQRIYDTGGLNSQETKNNQNVEIDDFDHRPRREAVTGQNFKEYTGTTSGAEDAD